MVGSIKLIVDRASQLISKRARVGCVAKDHSEKWITGEARNVGPVGLLEGEGHNVGLVGSLASELLAIFFGLQLAWRKNWRNLVLESDLMEAVTTRKIFTGFFSKFEERKDK